MARQRAARAMGGRDLPHERHEVRTAESAAARLSNCARRAAGLPRGRRSPQGRKLMGSEASTTFAIRLASRSARPKRPFVRDIEGDASTP